MFRAGRNPTTVFPVILPRPASSQVTRDRVVCVGPRPTTNYVGETYKPPIDDPS